MQNSYKATVPIDRIVAGDNPRRDFGDLDELVASIEATGGQPINPPVVVADGDDYRLVDGERRVRAMRRLHPGGFADVLVFQSYDEAEQAVAMLATDDKKSLTDEERARGFQRMLLLGVPTERVAKAMRRRRSDIDKAREVAEDAPEQATLDQMIVAAEFEGKDRAAVLNAAPEKYQAKAESIRRRIQHQAEAEAFRESFERLGIEPLKKAPEGYQQIVTVYTPTELENRAAEHADKELAVWPCEWNASYWVLGYPKPEVVETDEQRQAREANERRRGMAEALKEALQRYMVGRRGEGFPELRKAVGVLRTRGYNFDREQMRKALTEGFELDGEDVDALLTAPASAYEAMRFVRSNNLEWWRWVCSVLPAAMYDGFQPSEEDLQLLEMARDAYSEWEHEQAEQGADDE